MTKKLVSLLLALAVLLMSAAFAETDTAISVTDMMGQEITLDAPATRVVTVSAATCEIVYALGAGDTIVGRGTYCDYPADALEITSVQSGYDTNIEEIIALDPQVVFMSTMAQSEEQVKQLTDAGIAVVVSDAQTIDGVYESIALIGSVLGKDAEAEALIADMKAGFADLTVAEDSGKTVYFEISPLQWGLWTAGPGTFMDEIATMLGLTNVFHDLDSEWAQVSEEQVIERNPDYIVTVTMYYGEGPTPIEEIMDREGWEGVTAIENQNVFNADNDSITRPGPRLVEGAKALSDFVYGE